MWVRLAGGERRVFFVRDKEQVKEELLARFRSAGARAGSLLPPKWLQRFYLPSFTADEEPAFEEAVNELVADGLVELVQRGTPNLRLTRRGAEHIRGEH